MELLIDRCNWNPLKGFVVYKRKGESKFYFDVMRKTIIQIESHNRGAEICEYGKSDSIYKPIIATIPPLNLQGIPTISKLFNSTE